MENLSAIEVQPDFNHPSLYINRELSWLEFNRRVLEEAMDPTLPLLERVKFLAIFSNNLDEFYMIRVAGLRQQVLAGISETPADGMTPLEQMIAIRNIVVETQTIERQCWKNEIMPALAQYNIQIITPDDLTRDQRAAVRDYFRQEIFPVLTPLAVDPGRPFPHISNLSLNLAVVLRDDQGNSRFARLKIPISSNLRRFISVAEVTTHYDNQPYPNQYTYLFLDDIVQANLDLLFPGMTIEQVHLFRVIRDADVEIAEDEAPDLLETIERGIRQRRFGEVILLMVTPTMPQSMRRVLMEHLDLGPADVYEVEGPLGMADFFQLTDIDMPDLKYPNFVPAYHPAFESELGVFEEIRRRDILLHHPYDSFTPFVDLIKQAAHDPDVMAIKLTLYRVGSNSPIVQALLEAREAGKQVAVLVELKARFDEENNIVWARRLEAEGVHVVYGLVGLKTHAKVALIIRREQNRLRRYVHMSTGNYNASTARIYTDLGWLTSREDIADDVTELFNRLTGYAPKATYHKLLVAPEHLRPRMIAMIEREIAHAEAGRPAHIVFKVNSLTDPSIIRKLYEASFAGVKIDIIARGICCLRPNLPQVSENIHVRSIVGRFLEHSRIYWFTNGGQTEVYVGSADMMNRNLSRRVETVFPIEDKELKGVVWDEILQIQLADNTRARVLQSDGTWVRLHPAEGESALDSQQWAMERSRLRAAWGEG
ncbi:MAG: polyphosphate kinase 1 [Anaerolineae bacterium]|nr:polyphosphate kinase 1 [Anaerolineae bacterium]